LALGLEGSDYNLNRQQAEWRLLPKHLFTCDITKPFRLLTRTSGQAVKFDVISAFEVLEHLPEDTLPAFFGNVRNHLAAGGLFVASVATSESRDPVTGAVWHVTIKPREWWTHKAKESGLVAVDGLFTVADFPRGSGNALSRWGDWNAETNPELGFHLVARQSTVDSSRSTVSDSRLAE
jgi:hypothetical protein